MDGNPPPGPQASCRLARRANPTPLVDNHRKHHHRHPQKPCQETWMLGRARLAATVARMESWTPGSREPSSCPRRHLPRRRLHAPNAPANNAITLAIIIHNKRKLPKPFNSFPPCRQAQAGPARNHKTRLTAPLSPTETASFQARQPRPLARPGYADQSRPAPQQRVSNLKIAASNASTRAAIRTPITSHQQAWDHLGRNVRTDASGRRGNAFLSFGFEDGDRAGKAVC